MPCLVSPPLTLCCHDIEMIEISNTNFYVIPDPWYTLFYFNGDVLLISSTFHSLHFFLLSMLIWNITSFRKSSLMMKSHKGSPRHGFQRAITGLVCLSYGLISCLKIETCVINLQTPGLIIVTDTYFDFTNSNKLNKELSQQKPKNREEEKGQGENQWLSRDCKTTLYLYWFAHTPSR